MYYLEFKCTTVSDIPKGGTGDMAPLSAHGAPQAPGYFFKHWIKRLLLERKNDIPRNVFYSKEKLIKFDSCAPDYPRGP